MSFVRKLLKVLIGTAVTLVGLCVVAVVALGFALGIFGGPDQADLIENYKDQAPKLEALKSYFNALVPAPYQVYIEFGEEEQVDLWVFRRAGVGKGNDEVLFQQWGFNPYTAHPSFGGLYTYAEVKTMLGWNEATFREIKRRLNEVNCISVSSGEPTEIGFARRGLGKYFYNLFSQPLSDSLRRGTRWNDGCHYRLYNEQVVLEYRGAVPGPDCFPD